MGRQGSWTGCGRRQPQPAWWTLYGIAALLVTVVGLVQTQVDGEGLREVLELVTVVAGFGLIAAWVRHNRIALDIERGRRRP